MIRRLALIVLGSLALAATAQAAMAKTAPRTDLTLERVVIVQRHGVRPPIPTNQELAAYAEKPWPAWPVKPGELTPHGGETVRLVGRTLRHAYRDLLPAEGCRGSDQVMVWGDGADERTRHTGEILADALAPNCGLKAAWAPPLPRDPIFNGDRSAPACRSDPDAARAGLVAGAGPSGMETPATLSALKHLQAILAPTACAGGTGTCFLAKDPAAVGANGSKAGGSLAVTGSLAEDLLLEYAEGMPRADVGWGRAGSAAEIAAVMPVHERAFELYRRNLYSVSRDGAPMARLILAALAGEPRAASPSFGPETRVLALTGHDTNLVLMGGMFGLTWSFPDEPDATAPATALAFELWSDHASGVRYVRPVIYYATLDQLRTLAPASAHSLTLSFAGCASGPMGSCALDTLRRQTLALIPPGCGEV